MKRFWTANDHNLKYSLGGSASAYTAYALAEDFANGAYWNGGTQYSPASALPGYAYTRTGTVSFVNSTSGIETFAANVPPIVTGKGYMAYGALTNLLLNAGSSSGLSTQNVTVTAQAYTLAFIGTGTVTLSGTSTSGPLVGTGATTQVALNFTPTAGTLTLTVTGSVTYAVLVAGTFAAPGVPIIATAGATASIGASDLELGATLPNGDFIAWAVLNLTVLPTVTSRVLVFSTPGVGSSNDALTLQVTSAGTLNMACNVGGVSQPVGTGIAGAVTVGRCVALVRRNGGIYSVAAKKVDTSVVIGADGSGTGSVPTNGAVEIGASPGGTLQPGFGFEFVGQKNGSFTDADITAILTAA